VATEVGSSKVWSEVASLGRSEGYGSRASRFADEASSDEDDAQAAADLLSVRVLADMTTIGYFKIGC
jgi:hypothetical protein